MMRYSIAVLSLFVALLTSACHAMTRTPAERCLLIDLQQERGKEALPLLLAFAKRYGLEPELSHPVHPRYIRGSKEQPSAEVNYAMSFGPHGAVLTLFRFDSQTDRGLPAAFDRFVEQELKPRYKVTPCSEVPDFKTPEVVS